MNSTRLSRLVQQHATVPPPAMTRSGAPTIGAEERCELCAAPIGPEHRHLLDIAARRLVCACGACSTLFPDRSVGRQQFRLVPDEVREPNDFVLDDVLWAELAIPVDVAFFFLDTAVGRVVCLYPGALGVTESALPLSAWSTLVERNPILAQLEPDVRALLVNRTRGAREHWIVPIDVCYRVAGLIRRHWKGLGGGDEVWQQLGAFFAELRRRSGRSRANDANSTIVMHQENPS
jgi:hypothetical protein